MIEPIEIYPQPDPCCDRACPETKPNYAAEAEAAASVIAKEWAEKAEDTYNQFAVYAYSKNESDALLADKANAADVYTKAQADALLADKANAADVYTKAQADTLLADKANAADVYTKAQADTLLADKANAADVYTKAQADTLLADKANAADVYTKTQADALLADKANAADVYTKAQADTLLADKANAADVYTKTQADALLADKANAADVYTKAQADTLLADKANAADFSTTMAATRNSSVAETSGSFVYYMQIGKLCIVSGVIVTSGSVTVNSSLFTGLPVPLAQRFYVGSRNNNNKSDFPALGISANGELFNGSALSNGMSMRFSAAYITV